MEGILPIIQWLRTADDQRSITQLFRDTKLFKEVKTIPLVYKNNPLNKNPTTIDYPLLLVQVEDVARKIYPFSTPVKIKLCDVLLLYTSRGEVDESNRKDLVLGTYEWLQDRAKTDATITPQFVNYLIFAIVYFMFLKEKHPTIVRDVQEGDCVPAEEELISQIQSLGFGPPLQVAIEPPTFKTQPVIGEVSPSFRAVFHAPVPKTEPNPSPLPDLQSNPTTPSSGTTQSTVAISSVPSTQSLPYSVIPPSTSPLFSPYVPPVAPILPRTELPIVSARPRRLIVDEDEDEPEAPPRQEPTGQEPTSPESSEPVPFDESTVEIQDREVDYRLGLLDQFISDIHKFIEQRIVWLHDHTPDNRIYDVILAKRRHKLTRRYKTFRREYKKYQRLYNPIVEDTFQAMIQIYERSFEYHDYFDIEKLPSNCCHGFDQHYSHFPCKR